MFESHIVRLVLVTLALVGPLICQQIPPPDLLDNTPIQHTPNQNQDWPQQELPAFQEIQEGGGNPLEMEKKVAEEEEHEEEAPEEEAPEEAPEEEPEEIPEEAPEETEAPEEVPEEETEEEPEETPEGPLPGEPVEEPEEETEVDEPETEE